MTRPDRSSTGVFAVGLGIVCMGAIAAVLWWKHAERKHLQENERAASGAVWAICSGLGHPHHPARNPPQTIRSWSLGELHATGVIPAEISAADPARPGATPYRGYWFTILQGAPGEQTVCAYPARYGRTGRNTFIYTPRNGRLKKDIQGIPPTGTPSEAEIQMEWAKYD